MKERMVLFATFQMIPFHKTNNSPLSQLRHHCSHVSFTPISD